jgi:hypothetical protein
MKDGRNGSTSSLLDKYTACSNFIHIDVPSKSVSKQSNASTGKTVGWTSLPNCSRHVKALFQTLQVNFYSFALASHKIKNIKKQRGVVVPGWIPLRELGKVHRPWLVGIVGAKETFGPASMVARGFHRLTGVFLNMQLVLQFDSIHNWSGSRTRHCVCKCLEIDAFDAGKKLVSSGAYKTQWKEVLWIKDKHRLRFKPSTRLLQPSSRDTITPPPSSQNELLKSTCVKQRNTQRSMRGISKGKVYKEGNSIAVSTDIEIRWLTNAITYLNFASNPLDLERKFSR